MELPPGKPEQRPHLWRNIAVCLLAGTLFGAGCEHLAPSMYISSDLGIAISIVLMVGGGLLLLLVRGFDRKRIRRAELLTVFAGIAGQIAGMVGGTLVQQEMLRRDCASTGDKLSCLGEIHKKRRVQPGFTTAVKQRGDAGHAVEPADPAAGTR